MTLFSASKKLLQRYLSEDRGSVVVLTAVMAPVIIGGVGLGVETGHWYQKQRHLQHLADVASFSGATQLSSGGDLAAITAAATTVADVSGYDTEIGEIQVYSPPISGIFAGDDTAVEVVITEQRKRWFSAIYQSGHIEVTGRAVSKIEGSGDEACVLALSTYESYAIYVTGNTDVALDDCIIASNSRSDWGFKVWGNAASLEAACGHSAGGAFIFNYNNLDLSKCDEITSYGAPIADPYADVPEPSNTGSCKSKRVGRNNQTTTVTPTDYHPNGMKSRRYCGGLWLKGNVHLKSGLYIIDGGTFKINSNANITSDAGGVTFYMINGATISFNGGSDIDLKAPSSGPTSGMLFFGSRTQGGGGGMCSRNYGTEHKINGGARMNLHGAVYFPTQDVIFSGNSSTENGCTQIIANTVKMTGNSDISIQCESSGISPIEISSLVKLVE